ncbi:MAG TPA: DUF4198 domain-containing protein [Burkholderiaceae bacterium]
MIRPTVLKSVLAATALFACSLAHADRTWLLPSSTMLSLNDGWVTFDAEVSDTVFTIDHVPLPLDGLVLLAPDGSSVQPENPSTGHLRSSFDLKLSTPGTYRAALVSDTLFASYRVNGEMKRARGSAEAVAKEIPPGATELRVTQSISRNETFVTAGKPTDTVLKPSGHGLEMMPQSHPNDIGAGSTTQFRFLLDGQPAAGILVSVVAGGVRYRERLGEQSYTTDARGEVSVAWGAPGMYWLGAAPPRDPALQGPNAPAGTLDKPTRRVSYSATLEVLPQ